MKRKLLYFTGLFILVIVLTMGATIVRAVFDGEKEAVHIKPEEIENSTLIIGTHLIHLSALTDALYDVAVETAEVSGQTDMYYKSELAGGTWYMISDASELSDITSKEKRSEASIISGLYVRYHTKSDGITYDLLNNKAVCLFDTVDPYALDKLPEMDALNTQYENLTQKSNTTDTDKANKKSIEKMIKDGKKLKKENKDLDKGLQNLNQLYLKNAKDGDTASILQDMMKEVDSKRRADVYQELVEKLLPDFLDAVQIADGNDTDREYVDYSLVDAAGTVIEEAQNKLIECEGNALTEGDTALGKEKYRLVNDIISHVEQGNEEAALSCVNTVKDLNNIESGITMHPDSEAILIQNILLPVADEVIKGAENEEALEKAFAESEFLIKALVSRMSPQKAEEFLVNRINELDTLVEGITDDRLKAVAEGLKENSKAVMEELLSSVENSIGEGNRMSSLMEKKQQLNVGRLAALDENNLEEAARIEGELSELDKEIEALKSELNQVIQSDTAGEAQKAKALAELKSESSAASLIELKEDVLESIKNHQYDAALQGLEGMKNLAEGNPELMADALKDIYKSAAAKLYMDGEPENAQALKNILDTIEELNAENVQLLKEEPEEEVLEEGLSEALGKALEEADEKEKSGAAVALKRFADNTGSDTAKEMAKEMAADLYNENNPYVYEKLKNEAEEFIPLDTVAKCCSYRYIFHEGNKTGILRKGTEYYEYSAFSKTVMTKGGQSEEMNTYARYQSAIYLDSEYMGSKFGISCEQIPDTEYSFLVTQDMEDLITEMSEGISDTGTD